MCVYIYIYEIYLSISLSIYIYMYTTEVFMLLDTCSPPLGRASACTPPTRWLRVWGERRLACQLLEPYKNPGG